MKVVSRVAKYLVISLLVLLVVVITLLPFVVRWQADRCVLPMVSNWR